MSDPVAMLSFPKNSKRKGKKKEKEKE